MVCDTWIAWLSNFMQKVKWTDRSFFMNACVNSLLNSIARGALSHLSGLANAIHFLLECFCSSEFHYGDIFVTIIHVTVLQRLFIVS